MQYSAHETFVAPARVRPEIWRILIGLLMIASVYALGVALIFGGIFVVSGPGGAEMWISEMMAATGPTGTLLLLATFIGMAIGPMVAVVAFHDRSIGSLFGPVSRTLRHFAIAMAICAVIYAASFLLPNDLPIDENLTRTLWLSFLPLALVGVFLQTGAEEILFRGYLQSQLAARFRSPLIWMVLPSVLFAVLHYDPGSAGSNAIYVVLAAGLFGLLAADLTARTGSIGAAWGFHFANNVVAILVVSLEGPLSGLARYTAQISAADEAIRPLIFLDMGTTLVTWIVIRLVVSRL